MQYSATGIMIIATSACFWLVGAYRDHMKKLTDPADRTKKTKPSPSEKAKTEWPPVKRGVIGVKLKAQAEQQKKLARELDKQEPNLGFRNWDDARCLEREAEPYLKPLEPIQMEGGGEAVPQGEYSTYLPSYFKDTLGDPDQIAMDASLNRMEQAADAHVLELALDASQTIQARNSLEKMLVHQMAACHAQAMRLIAKANSILEDTVDIQRLVNASARLMSMYQQGLQTLQKLRTGGRQEVIVQHVKVSDGGQALVTGKMNPGEGVASSREGGK